MSGTRRISTHQNTKNVKLLSAMNTTCMTNAPRSASVAFRLVASSAAAKRTECSNWTHLSPHPPFTVNARRARVNIQPHGRRRHDTPHREARDEHTAGDGLAVEHERRRPRENRRERRERRETLHDAADRVESAASARRTRTAASATPRTPATPRRSRTRAGRSARCSAVSSARRDQAEGHDDRERAPRRHPAGERERAQKRRRRQQRRPRARRIRAPAANVAPTYDTGRASWYTTSPRRIAS